jgi:hypothetical protein
MSQASDSVTVYRSMDTNAREDCESIVQMLKQEGIAAVLIDDTAPEVMEGVFEVRVSSADSTRAEKLIDESSQPEETEVGDDSSALDLETIYHSGGGNISEFEVTGIKNLLELNGITAVLVGDSVVPTGFDVRVAREQADRARQVIAEAESGGPAAADEAEQASET